MKTALGMRRWLSEGSVIGAWATAVSAMDVFNYKFYKLNQKYIITTYNKNVLIVDQQRAHERIVYEHYLKTIELNNWDEVHFYEDRADWLYHAEGAVKEKFPNVKFISHLITNIKDKMKM